MSYFFKKTGLLTAALLAGLLAASARAGAVKVPEAAPGPRSYVNDLAGVLDAGTARKLDGALAELDAKARAQVAVLTVKSLDGADLETYAVKTYKKWGIGDKKTNRGVLLLVAVDDHKSRIEVGYGLEGILPDGLTGAIQDKYMVPYFKAGDYSSGISQGALAVASVIARDSGVSISGGYKEARGRPLPPLTFGQKVIAALLIVLFLYFVIRHPILAYFLLNSITRGGGSLGGGGGGGFGGGGFGGFGGGASGGGGSSRSW